jgi:hypothetical protein
MISLIKGDVVAVGAPSGPGNKTSLDQWCCCKQWAKMRQNKRPPTLSLEKEERLESIGCWDPPPAGYQERGENNEKSEEEDEEFPSSEDEDCKPKAKRRRATSTSEEEDEESWSSGTR